MDEQFDPQLLTDEEIARSLDALKELHRRHPSHAVTGETLHRKAELARPKTTAAIALFVKLACLEPSGKTTFRLLDSVQTVQCADLLALIGQDRAEPVEVAVTPPQPGSVTAEPSDTQPPTSDLADHSSRPRTPAATETADISRLVKVEQILIDPHVQPRQGLNKGRAASFADLMRDGVEFDPIVLMQDGERLVLADGHHRLAAAKQAGR